MPQHLIETPIQSRALGNQDDCSSRVSQGSPDVAKSRGIVRDMFDDIHADNRIELQAKRKRLQFRHIGIGNPEVRPVLTETALVTQVE
jgi:hypothetical protein